MAAGGERNPINQLQNGTNIKTQLNYAFSTINATLSSIPGVLSQSFESNTISYIVISGVLVGSITAIIKYVTDQYLPERKLKKARKRAIQKYSYPLFYAAYLASRNIYHLLSYDEIKKFDNQNNNTYHLSILYSIGCFVGWYNILDKEAFLEEIERSGSKSGGSKKMQKFSSHSSQIFRGMSSVSYFHASIGSHKEEKKLAKFLYHKKIDTGKKIGIDSDIRLPSLLNIEVATIEPSVLNAIGELMTKNTQNPKQDFKEVIGFAEFARCYDNCSDFKKWFSYIERIISGLSNSESDARWNKMVVLLCHLIVFIQVVGRSYYMSKPDYFKIHILFYIHPKVHYFYIRYKLIKKIEKYFGLDKRGDLDKRELNLIRKIEKYFGLDKSQRKFPTGNRHNWEYPNEIRQERTHFDATLYLESLHPVVLRRLFQDFINLGHSRKSIMSMINGQIYFYDKDQ